jgi:hypothetical protein
VLVLTLVVIGVGGLALAAWAHRRSSVVLGLLVCATTGLIISPITWVHHIVWVVPVIIWLAAGADRPRHGPLLAGCTAVLFIAAPIWWVPTSWKVTNHAPELHQNFWQLLVGNSFLFAMLAFLVGVACMLVRRSGVVFRWRLENGGGVDGGHGPPRTVGAIHGGDATKDLELVGSESSGVGPGRAGVPVADVRGSSSG